MLTIPRLQLHLTERCNLACRYCYARQRTGGDMSWETGCRAITYYLDRLADGLEDVWFSFFGGEPLLEFGLMQRLVAFAKDECARRHLRPHFSITTNGALLGRESAEYLAHFGFTTLISWDGAPASQDQFRILPGGAGSSAAMGDAWPHIRRLPNVGVRLTWTGATLSALARNVRYFADLGLDWIGFAPLDQLTFTDTILDEYRRQVFDMVEFWLSLLQHKRVLVLNPLLNMTARVMDPRAPLHFHMHACDLLVNRVSVSPDGSLFPCHRFMARGQWRLGSVWEGTLDAPSVEALQRFHREGLDGCLSMLDVVPSSPKPCPRPDVMRLMEVTLEGSRRMLERGVAILEAWSPDEIPPQARPVMARYRQRRTRRAACSARRKSGRSPACLTDVDGPDRMVTGDLVLDLDFDYCVTPTLARGRADRTQQPEDRSLWIDPDTFAAWLKERGLVRPGSLFGSVRHHEQVLSLWQGWLAQGHLTAPFTVLHIDAHPDLMDLEATAEHAVAQGHDDLPWLNAAKSGDFLQYAVRLGWTRQILMLFPDRETARIATLGALGLAEASAFVRKPVHAMRRTTTGGVLLTLRLGASPLEVGLFTRATLPMLPPPRASVIAHSPEFVPPSADPAFLKLIQRLRGYGRE